MLKTPTLFLIALVLVCSGAAFAQTTAPDGAELTKLLNEFLAGASRNDAQIHDAFWADEAEMELPARRPVASLYWKCDHGDPLRHTNPRTHRDRTV